MLVRTKKISMFALTAVAAGLALTACDNNGTDAASSSKGGSSSSSSSASTHSPAPVSKTAKDSSPGSSAKDGVS
ncbi:hypothetical protein ACWGKJ_21320, partial [Streptomyces sp. NPDC054757]